MNEVNATPHAELIADLMNPNNPKNDREHAAVREIERLREALAPCPTCEALARTVMLDQTSHDTTPQQRPWVGLTDDEIKEIVGPYGDTPIKGYTRKLFDQIEAKLKEKNNG